MAHDLALKALEMDPADTRAAYLAVLALARSGAAQRALEQFVAFGLDSVSVGDVPDDLAEDIGVLQARLIKDGALAAHGREQRERAAVAARRYEAAYRALGRPFACVNAATMWRLAGHEDRSRELARDAVGLVSGEGRVSDYWAVATEAEARLLLDDEGGAREALRRAVQLEARVADRASTRRQLSLVCAITGGNRELLDILGIPRVIHYTGHMAGRPRDTGMDPDEEPRVAAEVTSLLASRDVGFGYGALACGADLIVAEALLARGAELHVVLPFSVDDFVDASVLPGGAGWRERFDACLGAASSVTIVTDRGGFETPLLFAHGSEVAMGHAILRASYLGAEAEQLAVWDGQPATGSAGTAIDIATWSRGSRPTHLVTVEPRVSDPVGSEKSDPSAGPTRVVRALLFADVRGFSRLTEEEIPAFVECVLEPLAGVLDRFDERIRFRNTWGDGLYVVFDDVGTAAVCALALQDAMEQLDFVGVGLPADLALRIGGHAGPVFERPDPITRRPCFYGVEVTRTARIEPGTPVGDVYVTDAFAALVALDDRADLSCQYVGPVPTAKGFGVLPLYALRRHDRSMPGG